MLIIYILLNVIELLILKYINTFQTDPGHYWNYFFSLLATIILLMIIKSRRREYNDDFDQVEVFMFYISLNRIKVHNYIINLKKKIMAKKIPTQIY